jgi:hypothetical protein
MNDVTMPFSAGSLAFLESIKRDPRLSFMISGKGGRLQG